MLELGKKVKGRARCGAEGCLFDGRQISVVFVFVAVRRMKNVLLCKSTCILEDVRDDDGLYQRVVWDIYSVK